MSDVKPVRLQLSRKKGFSLQEHSRAVNGLPAVNCARPNKWGNHWRVGERVKTFKTLSDGRRKFTGETVLTPVTAVQFYREDMATVCEPEEYEELKRKNLACWCQLCAKHKMGKPLDVACPDCAPCHVDVLGDILCEPA